MEPADQVKLQSLLCDVFLIPPDEFSFESAREDIESWDSLALMSVGLGIQKEFGRTLTPEQLGAVETLSDLCRLMDKPG